MDRYFSSQYHVSSSSEEEDEEFFYSDDDDEYNGVSYLDRLYIDIIKLQEEMDAARDKLSSVMQTGFLNLANCRYLMGSNNVCTAQLPGDEEEVEAKFTVLKKMHSGSICYYFIGTVDEFLDKQKEAMSSSKAVSKKYANPLAWFGALVPGQLKQAQTYFRKALFLCIDIASYESRLVHVCRMYAEHVRSKQRKTKSEAKP